MMPVRRHRTVAHLAGRMAPAKMAAARHVFALASALMLAGATAARAAAPEASAPPPTDDTIHIKADHMRLNIESGNSTYSGHVVVRRGPLRLEGERVTIFQQNDEVERILVNGEPARYTHVTDTRETIHATSRQMLYQAASHRLTLTGDARLSQPEHTIRSQKIVYDTVRQTVIAGQTDSDAETGKVTDDERVNIILTPKKSAPAPAGQAQPPTEP